MPFFNCSTSLFAYIIYFGEEKNRKEKIFRWGNSASPIHTIGGGGMLLIAIILLKIIKIQHIYFILYI